MVSEIKNTRHTKIKSDFSTKKPLFSLYLQTSVLPSQVPSLLFSSLTKERGGILKSNNLPNINNLRNEQVTEGLWMIVILILMTPNESHTTWHLHLIDSLYTLNLNRPHDWLWPTGFYQIWYTGLINTCAFEPALLLPPPPRYEVKDDRPLGKKRLHFPTYHNHLSWESRHLRDVVLDPFRPGWATADRDIQLDLDGLRHEKPLEMLSKEVK